MGGLEIVLKTLGEKIKDLETTIYYKDLEIKNLKDYIKRIENEEEPANE